MRYPRPVIENVPLHIIQRGNNRNSCFFADADYRVYLAMLGASAAEYGCRIHAYVLMTNHVHILATPTETSSPARMMKGLGERYVQYANKRYGRSGTLWQGRYRSCLVDNEKYFLVCQRYIELNPVRAGMVADPLAYAWSSYKANAYGAAGHIVTPHPIYTSLAASEMERQLIYRSLFEVTIPDSLLEQVRHATNGNTVFGTSDFIDNVGAALGRDFGHRHAGRKRAWRD